MTLLVSKSDSFCFNADFICSERVNLIFSILLRVMSISDSIEGSIDADIGFDAIEVFVLGSRLVSTGDLVIRIPLHDTIDRMVLCCKVMLLLHHS